MQKKFLDALTGLPVKEAVKRIKAKGHKVELVPEECLAVTSITRGNTVIVWQQEGKVRTAEAGDPLELT